MGLDRQIYLGPYVECPCTPDSPHRYDVVGDELSDIDTGDESTLLLIPNVTREGAPRHDIDWEDTQVIDLQSADPASEIAWFRDAFAIEIDALEEMYGKVVLRWGLCQWWA